MYVIYLKKTVLYFHQYEFNYCSVLCSLTAWEQPVEVKYYGEARDETYTEWGPAAAGTTAQWL